MTNLTAALASNDLDTIADAVNDLDLPAGFAAVTTVQSQDCGQDWREVLCLGWEDSDDCLTAWIDGSEIVSQDPPEMAFRAAEVEAQIRAAIKRAWDAYNDQD